jgi:predicted DNA-binding transcriptional regulator YafY
MPINKNNDQRFKILNELLRSPRWYSIRELADWVNEQLEADGKKPVTDRTIRNDLETMQDIYLVEITCREGKYKYADPDDSIDKFSLSNEEKEVMEMARHAFAIFRGTPFFDHFDAVFSRITGSKVLRNLQQGVSSRLIQVDEQGTDTGVKWLQILYKAIIQRKSLRISYKPYGQPIKTRTVSPYMLKEYRNKWYMIAHAREIGEGGRTNLFKLFRIEKIESSKEPYVSDEHFNPDGYFKHSLGIFHSHELQPVLVHLFFLRTIAPLILESPLHSSMKVLRETEAGIEVTMYVFNTVELKNLVLSFGEQCRVIAPVSLQEEIRTSLMQALAQYQGDEK